MRRISATFALLTLFCRPVQAAEADRIHELENGSQLIAECVAKLNMALDDRAFTNHRRIDGLRRAMLNLGLEYHREIAPAREHDYLALVEEARLRLVRDFGRTSRRAKRDFYQRVVPACEEIYVGFRDTLREYRALSAALPTGSNPR